jgi:hypothetical protein
MIPPCAATIYHSEAATQEFPELQGGKLVFQSWILYLNKILKI